MAAERSSRLGLSGALAFQVNPQMFVGGEVRYLRSYAGFGLNRFDGHALFAGPTFYAQLSESVSLSAAFSTQIAGNRRPRRGGASISTISPGTRPS